MDKEQNETVPRKSARSEVKKASLETYEEIILNCFRYLGFTRLIDVEVLTLREYFYRIKAYQLKQIDKEYDLHLQAWLIAQAKATKEQGKKQVPVFRTFKDFYDYEKRLKEAETERKAVSPKMRSAAQLAAKINAEGR